MLSILLLVSKTLAAYHTDETRRCQRQLVTVVINIIDENDGVFKAICLSSLIIAEDGTADEQSRVIIASF